MNHAKYQQLVEGQSSIAQKVLSVVPFREEWDSRQIRAELFRQTHSAPDLRVVEGCLRKLVDAGLVKELPRQLYQRSIPPKPPAPPAPAPPRPQSKAVQERPVPTSSEIDEQAFDRLARAGASLRDLAAQLAKVANEFEEAALAAQQQIQDERKKSQRFHQLKRLLAEEGE